MFGYFGTSIPQNELNHNFSTSRKKSRKESPLKSAASTSKNFKTSNNNKSVDKSIYLYITLHGRLLVNTDTNNKTTLKTKKIEDLFRYVKIPSNLQHFTKISLGDLGCGNFSNYLFDHCKISNIKKLLKKYKNYGAYNLFMDSLKLCSTHMTYNNNEFKLNRSIFKHRLKNKNFYSEFVYNKGNSSGKKLINKLFTNDGNKIIFSDQEIPINENTEVNNCQINILHDSLGLLTPEKIESIPYFTTTSITTQTLITILSRLGYTHIYLFDDSCNVIEDEDIETHSEYDKFKKKITISTKSRKMYYF